MSERKATVMDVQKALECSRGIADDELAGVPFTWERGSSNRPAKFFALHDLPEQIRTRVDYYLANGHPQPRETCSLDLPAPALADLDAAIRAALERVIKTSGKSRERIASEMSQLVGGRVTKHMLNAYTAISRTPYRFPLQLALAFEIATGSYCLTQLLAKRRGCALLIGEDIALVELARIERKKLALERRAQAIKERMRGKR